MFEEKHYNFDQDLLRILPRALRLANGRPSRIYDSTKFAVEPTTQSKIYYWGQTQPHDRTDTQSLNSIRVHCSWSLRNLTGHSFAWARAQPLEPSTPRTQLPIMRQTPGQELCTGPLCSKPSRLAMWAVRLLRLLKPFVQTGRVKLLLAGLALQARKCGTGRMDD